MAVKSSSTGPFTIPTAPAVGTTVQGGAANTFTTNAVQLIASTTAALFITGLHVQLSSTSKPTYVAIRLSTGASDGSIVGEFVVPYAYTAGATGTQMMGFVPIWPPIPVAASTRIGAKSADSVGSLSHTVILQCINQSNVVAEGSIAETVDVLKWNGTAVSSPATAGIPDVNVKNIDNDAASASGTVTFPNATLASTTNITAATGVDITKILGTAISAPATAGILDVNVKNMNNVTGAAITTVKAVQGLTTADTIATYTGDTPQTGDAYARLGAPAGASVSADVAAVKSDSGAIKAATIIQTGTATAGGAATITLQTALGADTLPVGCLVAVTGGTGVGQARVISGYVNATKVASVGHNWTTNPDNTSVYYIIFGDLAKVDSSLKIAGVVLADTVTTATTATNLTTNNDKSGYSLTAATGLGNQTSNITGNLSGSVGSVTGAVGSVTGAVGSVAGNVGGNVVGSVASVTARVTANTDQLAGQTVTAAAGVTFPTSVASPTNITAGTITTATNLTNAPTNGDLTAAMKASVNTEADTALSDYGALKPTTAGRTLDVTATGEAGIDFANIGAPTTVVNLSGTTIKTATDVEADTADMQSRLPAALSGDGFIKADLKSIEDELTSGNNATLKLKRIDIHNVSPGEQAVYINAEDHNAVEINSTYNDGVQINGGIFGNALRLLVSSGSGKSIVAESGISVQDGDLTLAAITDANWDEAIAGHLTGGTTGAALNGAGSAGDPWGTNIPGAYVAGTAGYILGNNIDAPIGDIPTAAENAAEVLSAATANPIDANIQEVNDVTLTGDGSITPWGPA